MSEQIDNLTERELRFGLLKIGLSLTFALLFSAFIVSLVFSWKEGAVFPIVLNALLLAVAVSILASGVLAILRIIDWFDARRNKKTSS